MIVIIEVVAIVSDASVWLEGVSWHRQPLSLFGLKEGVRQSNGVHSSHPRVGVKLGVNVEEYWHVHLFVRVQSLLLEAEALYLVEVLSSLKGDYVVGGDANDGFVCRVLCSIKSQCRFPWNHIDLGLLRSEVPLDAGVSVCIKRHLNDSFFDGTHTLNHRRVVSRHCCSPQARCLAVKSVEGYSGVRQSDHSNSSCCNVCQHSLVAGFVLLLFI